MYKKGDTIVISTARGRPYAGIKGIVDRVAGPLVWALWEDTNKVQAVQVISTELVKKKLRYKSNLPEWW